jgi:hypothetical protein
MIIIVKAYVELGAWRNATEIFLFEKDSYEASKYKELVMERLEVLGYDLEDNHFTIDAVTPDIVAFQEDTFTRVYDALNYSNIGKVD